MVRRLDEGFSNAMETKLEDFAQEYGGIDYKDIGNLSKCWDSLDATKKKNIQKLLSDVRKACKEAGMDASELASEYPEDKKTCDSLVKAIKDACKGTKKESIITEKNWSITVPDALARAFREELNAIDDWDSEEEQTEHIEKAMGALINICKFINDQDPDLFEDAEDEINNMLDNIYNHEEYEMDFEDAKGEIDYWLNDFWDTCDSENIFIPI